MGIRIKAVGMDIYGTIVASDDFDNCFPPRQGIEKFFDKSDSYCVRVYSTSDAFINNVKRDLESCFRRFQENFGLNNLTLDRFAGFYRLDQDVKDFGIVLDDLGLEPFELLVVGDESKDIDGAKEYGCPYLQVPKYLIDGEREFDFSTVNLEWF